MYLKIMRYIVINLSPSCPKLTFLYVDRLLCVLVLLFARWDSVTVSKEFLYCSSHNLRQQRGEEDSIHGNTGSRNSIGLRTVLGYLWGVHNSKTPPKKKQAGSQDTSPLGL